LHISDEDPNGIAALVSGISTIRYTNLSFPTNGRRPRELGDLLWVEWRDGSSQHNAWQAIAMHALLGAASHVSIAEFIANGGGVADFDLRFRVLVNANNEGAYIDNLMLTGHAVSANTDNGAPATVPEPGSLALAGLALVLCAGGFRRSIGAATVRDSHRSATTSR